MREVSFLSWWMMSKDTLNTKQVSLLTIRNMRFKTCSKIKLEEIPSVVYPIVEGVQNWDEQNGHTDFEAGG